MSTTTEPPSKLDQELDANTLLQLLENHDISLVDVRDADEHAREHIAQDILMPMDKLTAASAEKLRGKQVVLYCQSGVRSQRAAQKLRAIGHESVGHLKGGLDAWKRAGGETIGNPRQPISIMRQVQIIVGAGVLGGTLLGYFVSSGFLILSGFFGAGLLFAGLTGTCALASLLSKLPYNRIDQ